MKQRLILKSVSLSGLLIAFLISAPAIAEDLGSEIVQTETTVVESETVIETFGGGVDANTGESVPLESQTDIIVKTPDEPVTTVPENNVSIAEVYSGSFGMENGYLNLQSPSHETVIVFPWEEKDIYEFGFDVGAKNGDSSVIINYEDGSIDSALIDGQCCYSQFTYTSLSGYISGFVLSIDWDWWLLDNLYYVAEVQVSPEPTPEPSPSIEETAEPEPTPEVIETPTPEPPPPPPPAPEPEPEPEPEPQPEPVIEEEIIPEPIIEEIIEEEVVEDSTIEEEIIIEEIVIEEEVIEELPQENVGQLEEFGIVLAVIGTEVLSFVGDVAEEVFAVADEVVGEFLNLGDDLSPEVREDAQTVVVSTIIVNQIATAVSAVGASSAVRRR